MRKEAPEHLLTNIRRIGDFTNSAQPLPTQFSQSTTLITYTQHPFTNTTADMSSDYDYSDEDADYYDDEDMMDTQEDGQSCFDSNTCLFRS